MEWQVRSAVMLGLRPFAPWLDTAHLSLEPQCSPKLEHFLTGESFTLLRITPWGRSSPEIIRAGTLTALSVAREAGFPSLAFPVLGSGSGGVLETTALAVMQEAIGDASFAGEVRIVRFIAHR